MKKLIITLFSLLFLFSSVIIFSQNSNIGTNDFKLGMKKQAVVSKVKMKYNTKNLKRYNNNTLELVLKNVKAKMYFDHNDSMYKISVEIASDSDGAKVKKKLLTKEFGEPVVIKEDYNDVTKLFLYSKWVVKSGRYDIRLFESKYCRGGNPNPCVIVTTYTDTIMLKEFQAELEKRKRDEKLEKEKEKYDF